MDSGYFSEEILEVIEGAGYQYVVKAKEYTNLLGKAYDTPVKNWENYGYQKQAMFVTMKADKWDKERKFAIVRELKPEEDRKQLSFFESGDYIHSMYVTNTTWELADTVKFYEKRGNCENYIKETKYDMNIGSLKMNSFWANEAVFQMMMLSYNLFLLFKFDFLSISEYRQQIKTFRLKYVFLAGKIIKTARYVIMKLSEKYPYKDVYEKCLS